MPFKYHSFSPWDDNELCYARPGSPPAFFSLPSPVSPRVCSNCIPGIAAGSSTSATAAAAAGSARESCTQFPSPREPARDTISSSSSLSNRTPQVAPESPPLVLPPPPLKRSRKAVKGLCLPLSKWKSMLCGRAEVPLDESMERENLTSSTFEYAHLSFDEDLMEPLFGDDRHNPRKIKDCEGSSTSPAKPMHDPKSLQNIAVLSKASSMGYKRDVNELGFAEKSMKDPGSPSGIPLPPPLPTFPKGNKKTTLRVSQHHPSPSQFPELSSEPLHEDEVCDAMDLPMLWGDQLTSSSFVYVVMEAHSSFPASTV